MCGYLVNEPCQVENDPDTGSLSCSVPELLFLKDFKGENFNLYVLT